MARQSSSRSRNGERGQSKAGQSKAMPEILTLIKHDHEAAKKLFKEFEQVAQSDHEEAGALGQQILEELTLHAELEEQTIYPWLQKKDEHLYHEAEEEHHVAKLLIAELETMTPEDPTFEAKMMVLVENVLHHMKEEESEMFEKIRALPNDALQQAAEDWKARKGMDMAA